MGHHEKKDIPASVRENKREREREREEERERRRRTTEPPQRDNGVWENKAEHRHWHVARFRLPRRSSEPLRRPQRDKDAADTHSAGSVRASMSQ